MAVLSFPDPAVSTSYFENGISYVYDGEKWVTSGQAAYVPLTGAAMSGSVTVPERTITDTEFDLATGPYWTAGAIDIPNPTNAIAGLSGLIRLTDAPTSWDSNYSFSGDVPAAAGMVPFYVESPTNIIVGKVTPGG